MAGGGKSSNASRQRKRVEAAESDSLCPSLKRARDGSAFTKCEACQKDVAVALISFHNCSLDAKIQMNLESQVIEMAAEAKKKPEKRKAKQSEPKAKKVKTKNPNGKKRPPTAFFVFMDDFRKSFKEANPDCKSVATIAKDGGEKWKSLSDDEKKVYQDKAAELKAEYQKSLEAEAENEQEEDEGENEGKDETNIKEEKDDLTEDEEEEAKAGEEAKVKVEEVKGEEILDDFESNMPLQC